LTFNNTPEWIGRWVGNYGEVLMILIVFLFFWFFLIDRFSPK